MDHSRRNLEEERKKLEAEMEKVQKLLGTDLDSEAKSELAKLESQKQQLMQVMQTDDSGLTTYSAANGTGQDFDRAVGVYTAPVCDSRACLYRPYFRNS